MLEKTDLSLKLEKKKYKALKDKLEIRLGALQREAHELGVPVVVLFEGWDAAGKGTLINELILPLDPRGFDVHSTLPPNEAEAMRPFLWRFWVLTPAAGRIAIFDRSWYRRVLYDRVERHLKKSEVYEAFEDIQSFERQLTEEGAVIVKMFLHISKAEQKRRMKKLRSEKSTKWRVTRQDLERHRQYGKYLAATEDMLARTDSAFAPWTIIEAHDRRFATIKVFRTFIGSLERRIRAVRRKRAGEAAAKTGEKKRRSPSSILRKVDLSVALEREEYRARLKKKQEELRELEHGIYMRRIPVIILYEGWDAAGKGGNLRRLTQNLDPRGYEVVPIAKPNDIEIAHHYLWRFWMKIPKAGHITIFDRSWYGRVLVERVEGFCTDEEWQRAYRQINEMERHMVNFGAVVLKFWLQIDRDEQLRRFQEREKSPHKKWKITREDWRNREKWDLYEAAIEEMLLRTSTPYSSWTIVESNCKWYARVKVMDTVIDAIRRRL